MNFIQLPHGQTLQQYQAELSTRPLSALFDAEPDRRQRWTFEAAGISVDVSRNYLDEATFSTLLTQADDRQLEMRRAALLAGEAVNTTEHRPAWHTALRNTPDDPSLARSLDEERLRCLALADALRRGSLKGSSGLPITAVVCLGIGGSDLGPRLVTEALGRQTGPLTLRFVSNIDPAELDNALSGLDPQTTLIVAISKSFTTLETLENLKAAKIWLQTSPIALDPQHHTVAVTAQPGKAEHLGFHPKRILSFADWVGGRYSVWSACGLPVALAHGPEVFLEFLAGAAQMDQHFATAPLDKNVPVILGLLGAWYVNFWGINARAVFPYAQRLRYLPAYLQQLEMESLGKRVSEDGREIAWNTSPVVWGEVGTTAQHSVFQFLHQGSHWNPADFLVVDEMTQSEDVRHRILHTAAVAQIDALAWGDSLLGDARPQAAYGSAPGGRPGNLIHLPDLTPRTVGALLAMYEHRCFVQSVVWNINAFDQWGVEVGKKLLQKRMDEQETLP